MSGSSEEKKTYYRLAPCPSYDVEGMESWLEDMALEGLFLTGDGFFCGFGFFHKEEPASVRYRLQASEVPGGFLSDGDEPEEEQREISEALGWEFVTRRGEFYIYRSIGENVRELNTDPDVQAMTINQVKTRQTSSFAACMVWMILYSLTRKNGAVIVPMLYMKTWFYLFSIGMLLYFFLGSVVRFVYYTRLQKRIKNGEQLKRKKNWRNRARTLFIKNVLIIVLCCIWGGVMLGNIHRRVLFEDEIPLKEYTGNPPFVTMADIAPEKPYEIRNMGFVNTVTEWSDVLAPVNFIWEEYASVQVTEERTVSGLWDINYHELRWEWMAKLVAGDYLRMDKEQDFEFLGELDLDLDYAVAYLDEIHMTKIILRQGNKVLQGTFHEYSGEKEDYFTMEEWIGLMADSIKE